MALKSHTKTNLSHKNARRMKFKNPKAGWEIEETCIGLYKFYLMCGTFSSMPRGMCVDRVNCNFQICTRGIRIQFLIPILWMFSFGYAGVIWFIFFFLILHLLMILFTFSNLRCISKFMIKHDKHNIESQTSSLCSYGY